ncbi:MAG: hypothetical protein US52_C0008G0009 [candidate division WS6 bacterium GW2011_GWA2_37_6]|uniref:Uncharacterized protein n=1 Tax=candidate division WS6 bacterium GW2011_GWA2_37_6 TaxID=1619087 RepID=A0A0G0HC40_9BACT|nr:MAG: hypothetical protein US52_C0008G0009 [candidate division WS6 bacterium GW2011_GWA2_37_6]
MYELRVFIEPVDKSYPDYEAPVMRFDEETSIAQARKETELILDNALDDEILTNPSRIRTVVGPEFASQERKILEISTLFRAAELDTEPLRGEIKQRALTCIAGRVICQLTNLNEQQHTPVIFHFRQP